MTRASDGSQWPRSRKPSTLAGFAMPESRSPRPKTRPARYDATTFMKHSSTIQQMANHEHRGEAGAHEDGCGDHRAGRQPREPADAVTAGATRAVTRANAHEQPSQDQLDTSGLDLW